VGVHTDIQANVMVEYPIPEAQDMLSERLSTAQASLNTTEDNLEFIREQITTMEVNTARIFNCSCHALCFITDHQGASNNGAFSARLKRLPNDIFIIPAAAQTDSEAALAAHAAMHCANTGS
jgi:hypothetical protein